MRRTWYRVWKSNSGDRTYAFEVDDDDAMAEQKYNLWLCKNNYITNWDWVYRETDEINELKKLNNVIIYSFKGVC